MCEAESLGGRLLGDNQDVLGDSERKRWYDGNGGVIR